MTIWLARVCVWLLEGSKFLMKNELRFHVKTFILSNIFQCSLEQKSSPERLSSWEQAARRVSGAEPQCQCNVQSTQTFPAFLSALAAQGEAHSGNPFSEIQPVPNRTEQTAVSDQHICSICKLWGHVVYIHQIHWGIHIHGSCTKDKARPTGRSL